MPIYTAQNILITPQNTYNTMNTLKTSMHETQDTLNTIQNTRYTSHLQLPPRSDLLHDLLPADGVDPLALLDADLAARAVARVVLPGEGLHRAPHRHGLHPSGVLQYFTSCQWRFYYMLLLFVVSMVLLVFFVASLALLYADLAARAL